MFVTVDNNCRAAAGNSNHFKFWSQKIHSLVRGITLHR